MAAVRRHVKSIVIPHRAAVPLGGHHFSYKSPYFAVNTRHAKVDGPFSSDIDFSQLYLYHYVLKVIVCLA